MAHAESHPAASSPPTISYPNLYACLIDASCDQRFLTDTNHRNEDKLNKLGRILAAANNPVSQGRRYYHLYNRMRVRA